MARKKAREFSREFKVAAVLRMKAGESTARLAEELQLRRKLLYEWKQRMEGRRRGEPEPRVGKAAEVGGHAPAGQRKQASAADRGAGTAGG
ncbi:MAG: transposase [Bryobacteraceae bacterium]|jgi:transposase-like protein